MIRLYCQYSGAPAADWNAELTFTKIDSQLRVIGISNGNVGTDRWRRSVQLQKKLPFWLSCAHFLISLEPDWALPADAANCIFAKGCSGIRADILAICWTRMDDDKEVCFGKDVLQFKTRTLARLTRQLGSVRLNQFKWHEIFTRIAEAQTALGLDSNPAKLLNSRLGRKAADVETVISNLEGEVEDWEDRLDEQIEPHKQALEAIVTKVLGSPPSTGLVAMQSDAARRRELRYFLASEMIRKRIAPSQIAIGKWKPSRLSLTPLRSQT